MANLDPIEQQSLLQERRKLDPFRENALYIAAGMVATAITDELKLGRHQRVEELTASLAGLMDLAVLVRWQKKHD